MLDEQAQQRAITQTFEPEPGAPRRARQLVRSVPLDDRHARHTLDLLTTELVTNAVRHANTTFELKVLAVGGVVRVDVIDNGGGHPCIQPPDPARLGGRGLWLVDQLATRWGTRNDGNQTTVWFELDVD